MAAQDYDHDGDACSFPVPSKVNVRNHGAAWTPKDEARLRGMVRRGSTWPAISRALGRTVNACQIRAELLRVDSPIESKELDVNTMHLITLLQENYTTCNVVICGLETERAYTYKMMKDSGIAATDYVVVYARDVLRVGRVVEVHDEPQVDFKAPYALKWIVQAIDMVPYDEHVVKEAAALAHLNKCKALRERQKMLQDIFGGEDGLEELKNLINGS